MCGLAGFFSPEGIICGREAQRILANMQVRIAHRGSDASGQWIDAAHGIALGHQRLSIIDVSDNGNQPMTSPSGRFVIVFNGEIYNHLELREDLQAREPALHFVGGSDTESLLAGFDFWGIRETLRRATGMFAFALWDKMNRRLILGRDRFGEKPLYYGWQNATGRDVMLFASELKAIHGHPAFEKRLDLEAAATYFRRFVVQGNGSIFKGIYKLRPGTFTSIGPDGYSETVEYWSLVSAIRCGAKARYEGNDDEVIERTEDLLLRSVRRQMISDVPLGAFLSGGIDSSVVVAMMHQHGTTAVKTFTIGFAEDNFDEAPHAKKVADFLGTDHTMFRVTPADAQDIIPSLCEIYDEPFADSSQIPTFIVSRLAREYVTVCLTGDGADELFGGYSRYGKALRVWRRRNRLPATAWKFLSPVARRIECLTRGNARMTSINRIVGLLDGPTIEDFYSRWTDWSCWEQLTRIEWQRENLICLEAATDMERLMEHDLRQYLPDDILVKVDRAAMATSLETRAPFLDHELAEFAFSLPVEAKMRPRNGSFETKWAVRQVLNKFVPKTLIERPKQGFSAPIADWLRGALREWAGDYITGGSLDRDGFLNSDRIRQLWNNHQRGIANHSNQLWTVLMFCAWRSRWS